LEKLRKAQEEEDQKKPISDPAVQSLKTQVQATLDRVMASDESRYQMRSQIWSTTMCKGPPSLWMTINPSDLHDPTAQLFVGEDINLNDFVKTMGPNTHQRAQNIARDPYGASEYFHFIIHAILETLFRVKVTKYKIKSSKGVLSLVEAYFGVKEVQGRGTIHLHLLIWLKNTPSPNQLLFLLRDDAFREKIKNFLQANVRAYKPGMETAESIQTNSGSKDVAFTRPPPDASDYEQQIEKLETLLACVEQVHTCKLRRCLVLDPKTGQYRCKRRTPFECAPEDYVTPEGKCGPK
jgi:hypothetical protein